MSDLILSKHTMSSLEIAELAGKQHNDVLKAIRAMEPAWEKVTEGKFSLSEYRDSTGRALPCYELNYHRSETANHLRQNEGCYMAYKDA